MVTNYTNIKTHLLPQIIEHKNEHQTYDAVCFNELMNTIWYKKSLKIPKG